MNPRLLLLASLYALLAVTGARGDDDLISADRPGIADGSQTVKRGQFQIEAGLQEEHDRSDGIDSRQLLTPSLFRYGVTDRFEARIESDAYQRLRVVARDSRATSTGWAPVAIGFKVHFVDEALDKHRPSMGLIVRFVPPSGTGAFRSDRASGDARFAADYDLGKWSLNPNLGVAVGPDDENRNFVSALAALTIQYNLSSTVNAFVDGAVQAPEARHAASSLTLDAGAAWIVGRDTQFDLSAGWRGRGVTVPNAFVSAGVSHRF